MDRFFNVITKFNTIIIAVVGIMAIFVLSFLGYWLIRENTSTRHARGMVNLDQKADLKEEWVYGSLRTIPGVDVAILPLETKQSFSLRYSGKEANSIRNLLFINPKSKDSKWLLKNNDGLISYKFLKEEGNEHKDKDKLEEVLVILYYNVKRDTNNDSRLTFNDLKSIALSKPDGTGYREILTDVDVVLGHTLLDKTKLFIVYQTKDQAKYATVNLSDFSLGETSILTKVNVPQPITPSEAE